MSGTNHSQVECHRARVGIIHELVGHFCEPAGFVMPFF